MESTFCTAVLFLYSVSLVYEREVEKADKKEHLD